MRAIFFHFANTTSEAVAAHLTRLSDQNGHGWSLPIGVASPTIFVDIYTCLQEESEPEELDALYAALGALPDVSLVVHLSSRIDGIDEIRALAVSVLGYFSGVAWDSFTGHCWTLSEILSGAEVHGHAFFDYRGWHAEHTKCESPTE